jgi:hypothetical protein
MQDIDNELPDSDQNPRPIEDFEVDPQKIMSEIQSRLRQSRRDAAPRQQSLPSFSPATYPDKPHDIPYDMALYQLLDLANADHSQTGTTLDIRESWLSRVPLLGGLWRDVQIRLHGPALFYANLVADRQAQINSQLVEILNKLLAANQEQQREINSLKDELKQLRQQDR